MKSAIQQFIEDAIVGGWKLPVRTNLFKEVRIETTAEQIFLDPLAWQAVGKTRGWEEPEAGDDFPEATVLDLKQTGWNARWHQFIGHLADGKTIEEALSAFSPEHG